MSRVLSPPPLAVSAHVCMQTHVALLPLVDQSSEKYSTWRSKPADVHESKQSSASVASSNEPSLSNEPQLHSWLSSSEISV